MVHTLSKYNSITFVKEIRNVQSLSSPISHRVTQYHRFSMQLQGKTLFVNI